MPKPILRWNTPRATWRPALHWNGPAPSPDSPRRKPRLPGSPQNPLTNTMSDTFRYRTRPTSDGDHTTTQPDYRGTKTKAELLAEITARIGVTPLTLELALRTHHEVVIDWTTQGWKIEAFDGLLGFLDTCGGSIAVGAPEMWDFDTMNIDLRGHWGPEGEARARALFTSEKTGEQNRLAPVFAEVYDSETKVPNHYVVGKGLTCRFSNSSFLFDPTQGCKMRFEKEDGTYVDAAGYPYIKGKTVVCTPPAGLTGTTMLECTALINGSLRTSEYPFPLT